MFQYNLVFLTLAEGHYALNLPIWFVFDREILKHFCEMFLFER